MPLSLFCDALPYSELCANYDGWLDDMQVAPLLPNIAYSSSLHWQLYCDKYPDERGVLVDWTRAPEGSRAVRAVATLLRPLDAIPWLGWFSRKVLDRVVFRRNAFANVPYKFRKDFSDKGQYLFWKSSVYRKEEIFEGYAVISQDEGHLSFDSVMDKLNACIASGEKNIFGVLGFADSMGHTCRRGEEYSVRLKKYMDVLRESIKKYLEMNPDESVLIVSDHGMSTVEHRVDVGLEKKFGRQTKKSYIAYSDSAIMCVWSDRPELLRGIAEHLGGIEYGHLLTDEEREYYRATDKKFGDLIFILREGYVFEKNWFGISARKPSADGSGMHGFWPEKEAKDQIASIVTVNGREELGEYYDYSEAHRLIRKVMKGD